MATNRVCGGPVGFDVVGTAVTTCVATGVLTGWVVVTVATGVGCVEGVVPVQPAKPAVATSNTMRATMIT